MTNEQALEILKGLNETIGKIHTEVSTLKESVGRLQEQLEEAGKLSPEVQAELGKLRDGLDSIDDLVPDEVPDEPIEGPVDPAPEPE